MDGGRFVKAFLTLLFGQYSANKIVPLISKIIAILVILTGLFFWDIIIILIGLFIYYTTVKELREYEILRVLEGKSVKSFMVPVELVFENESNVSDCFKEMKKTMIPDAIIKYKDDGFGVVDVELISKVNKLYWPTTKIGSIAKSVDYVTEKENLAYVAQYMVAKDLEVIPVVDGSNKKILGIIKRTEFSDYIKIHKIL
jgi:CBS domain-containing protein